VYAYNLDSHARRAELELFECHQQDLENHTERLSRLATDVSERVLRDEHKANSGGGGGGGGGRPSLGLAPRSIEERLVVDAASAAEAAVSTRDMIMMLRDQTTAAAKFLGGILELMADDSNPFVDADAAAQTTVVHTSWYCAHCNVGKKECACPVQIILNSQQFPSEDRSVVEAAVIAAKGDLETAQVIPKSE